MNKAPKIGILTYHSSYNFGANLQALATQSALCRRGVEAVVVDYQDPDKQALYDSLTSPDQAELHREFANRYLHLSPRLTTSEEVRDYCLDVLDGVVVGSDAVFRIGARYDLRRVAKHLTNPSRQSLTTMGRDSLPPYWLPWELQRDGHRILKTSIAASASGTHFYLLDLRLYGQLRRSIRDFDRLTVRDGWTSLMIWFLSLGFRVPIHCPDPVFVLNDYIDEGSAEAPLEDVSDVILIAGGFPDGWLRALASEARAQGYRVGNLPNPNKSFEFEHADVRVELPLSPLGWYRFLANAGGYIGIRFHALVSCLANGTPFITVDPGRRFDLVHHRLASRYRDLCRRANVMDRYIVDRQVPSVSPQEVLGRLFDTRSLREASEYAVRSAERFEAEIDEIVRLVGAAST